MRGAAREALVLHPVLRVEHIERGRHAQAAPALRARQRGAAQTRFADVAGTAVLVGRVGRAKRAVGLEADHVAHPVLVDGGRHLGRAGAPRQAQLDAAAFLGRDAGHAVAGVVQLVEAGGAEGAAGKRAHAQVRGHLHAPAEAAGRVAAVDRVAVLPYVGLQHVGAELAGVAEHQRVVAALHVGGEGIGMRALVQVFHSHHELLAGHRRPGALQRELVAPGAKPVDDVAAALQVVVVVRELCGQGQCLAELTPVVERGHRRLQLVAKVGARILGVVRRRVFARIELRVEAAADQVQADALAGSQGVAQLELRGVARESIVVGVVVAELVAGLERRNALRALAAERHRVVEPGLRAARAHAAVTRSAATDGHVAEDVCRSLAAPREDLHHAAHGVGTVEAGAGAAQHLDALDLGQADGLELHLPERGRADAHAVDQHHRVARAGTADEHARVLARPAVARNLHAGLAAQQVFDGIGRALTDALRIDDNHVGRDAVERQRLAAATDDDWRQRGLGEGGRCIRSEQGKAKHGRYARKARCRRKRTQRRVSKFHGEGRVRTTCKRPLPRG